MNAITRLLLRLTITTAAVSTLCGEGITPFEGPSGPTRRDKVDELVFNQLDRLSIKPASPCSDAVFVRRVYLDVIGTLPAAHEAREFLLSKEPNKRALLIDRLLERDEFADYWAMKWSDILRVKAEFPINLWPNAAQAYHHWIRTSIRENKPYDQFARELLTASGSNFRDPPVNFFRAMQNREPAGVAQTVALTFMGMRAEKWPTNRLAGMAAFFSLIGTKATGEWKEEILFFDSTKTTNHLWQSAMFPDGTPATLSTGRDPREVFADWLIGPRNSWFARNMANRVWCWLVGRGIIHEPDDIRADNPPVNPELLTYLGTELASSHYDLKHLYRLILNSQVYQLSSVPKSNSPEATANFASYAIRRLDAEVLADALNEVTSSTEKYSSPIPEPFTFLPENQHSIALPDGSISSAFLELFGRPPRDTGLETERNNRITSAQRLHLLNSSHVLRKIEQSRMVEFQSRRTPAEAANGIYLGILSRFPTRDELNTIEAYFRTTRQRDAIVDVAWALINSPEFLYRH
jgi:hypothetical protein